MDLLLLLIYQVFIPPNNPWSGFGLPNIVKNMSFPPNFPKRLPSGTEYIFFSIPAFDVVRDSVVGIATRYGLDSPGIESRWGGEVFLTRPDRPRGPLSLIYNGYRVFIGGKAAWAWRWPPTPSSAHVEERVELQLYSPYGPSWPLTYLPILAYVIHGFFAA